MRRTLQVVTVGLVLVVAACGTADDVTGSAVPATGPGTGAPTGTQAPLVGTAAFTLVDDDAAGDNPAQPLDDTIEIGPAATDTFGGWIADGTMISPFDDANAAIAALDPALRTAVQEAARAAAADGVDVGVTSGWRSKGFQQRLFDDAVARYGSVDIARQFVASPEASKHVVGQAIDIGPTAADDWMIRNGSRFGLCQIYANEIWHFELVADPQGNCPPLLPNAAG